MTIMTDAALVAALNRASYWTRVFHAQCWDHSPHWAHRSVHVTSDTTSCCWSTQMFGKTNCVNFFSSVLSELEETRLDFTSRVCKWVCCCLEVFSPWPVPPPPWSCPCTLHAWQELSFLGQPQRTTTATWLSTWNPRIGVSILQFIFRIQSNNSKDLSWLFLWSRVRLPCSGRVRYWIQDLCARSWLHKSYTTDTVHRMGRFFSFFVILCWIAFNIQASALWRVQWATLGIDHSLETKTTGKTVCFSYLMNLWPSHEWMLSTKQFKIRFSKELPSTDGQSHDFVVVRKCFPSKSWLWWWRSLWQWFTTTAKCKCCCCSCVCFIQELFIKITSNALDNHGCDIPGVFGSHNLASLVTTRATPHGISPWRICTEFPLFCIHSDFNHFSNYRQPLWKQNCFYKGFCLWTSFWKFPK